MILSAKTSANLRSRSADFGFALAHARFLSAARSRAQQILDALSLIPELLSAAPARPHNIPFYHSTLVSL